MEKELTLSEQKTVSGGILPVLAVIGSFLTHGAVRGVGQYLLSRSLTTYTVFEASS